MRRTRIVRVLRVMLCVFLFCSLVEAFRTDVFASSAGNSATVPAQHVDNVFDIANEEYKTGNFEDSLRLYESLLSSTGLRGADIYYNIGNARFKLHNYGKAIVSYRRALRLAPRDQDIVANLSFVRRMTTDKIDQSKSTELLREIFFFHYTLNQTESEVVFLCAYLASVFFAATCLFRQSRILRWLTLIALMLALTFGASTIIKWYGTAHPNQAVVVVEEADLHTGPGHNYMVSFNLHDGAEMKVRKRENGWYQIELPDGRRGWLKDSRIEIV